MPESAELEKRKVEALEKIAVNSFYIMRTLETFEKAGEAAVEAAKWAIPMIAKVAMGLNPKLQEAYEMGVRIVEEADNGNAQ